MRRNLLRPACGLGRSEFLRAKESTRSFTTTQFFSSGEKSDSKPDKPANTRPNLQQRSERASKEVNAILNASSAGKAAPGGGRGGRPAAGGGSGPNPARKIINLRSLPRGRGGANGMISLNLMRLNNNNQAGKPDGGAPAGPRPGFTPRGGAGGFRGRGRGGGFRGNRERQEGGGGRGGRPRKTDSGERQTEEDYASRRRGKAKEEAESLEERQARIGREVGFPSQYNPSTTLESLVPFLPEVATESNPLGRLATAMTNMRVLTGNYLDPNPVINAEDMYRDYKLNGSMFFTDLAVKKAIEEKVERCEGEIPGPDAVIKETIVKKTILGEYEPINPAPITDSVAIAKNFHLKEGTYQTRQTKAFEAKLVELVSKAKTRAKKKDVKAKPQEAKGKASKTPKPKAA